MCNVEGPPLRTQVPRMMPGGDPLPIYLDHNATTPVAPEAWKAMMACQHVWGNPSSTHPYGLQAKFVLDNARDSVAKSLGVNSSYAPADCITFTSCGTESNNLAILGTVRRQKEVYGRDIIVTSNVEHPATAEVLKYLEGPKEGFTVIRIPVNTATGSIDVETFKASYTPVANRVALVTIMHANNETGSIQPLKEITSFVKESDQLPLASSESIGTREGAGGSSSRALVHADCAQTIGKIPLSVADLDIDLMSVVGHKFYAPKGVACLYRRPNVIVSPTSFGAGHEKGLRPGTENIILIAGFAAALTTAMNDQETNALHMRQCRDLLLNELRAYLEPKGCEVLINGSLDACLPNTLNCAIRQVSTGMFISGGRLLIECGDRVAASAGSACHSAHGDDPITISAPLRAVGVWLERAMGTLRLSTGKLNTEEEMRRAARIISQHALQQFLN